MPKTEHKTGSFEYEGHGRAVGKLRLANDYTVYWFIQASTHESEHMEQAIIKEELFKMTKDIFIACGTMCTSTANIDEGWGNFGTTIFSDVVKEFMKDAYWSMEIADVFDKLKDAVVNYVFQQSYSSLLDPKCSREALRDANEKLLLSYGFASSTAATVAKGTVNINRQHKNIFYTPFYGAAADVVQSVVDEIGFERAFEKYTKLSSKTRLSTQTFKKYSLK